MNRRQEEMPLRNRGAAIEQHAEGQLERGKGEKVRAREKTEVARRETEVLYQVLGDDRVDVAVEVRKVIAGGEGEEHHKHCVRG